MTIISDYIENEFYGIHSSQLIGEENPGTLDKHPLFFVWERIHTIEQQFPRSELEDHFHVGYLTSNPTSPHTSYQDLFDDWEADIKSQEQSHNGNMENFSATIGPLNGLVNFLIEVDKCMWISKLDEALRGDPTFKALIIWLLSLGLEHTIFETLHMTRGPEIDITKSYGEDEFFTDTHYDAYNCESVTVATTIDQLQIPSSIESRVVKDGDNEAVQLLKGTKGQLVKICSDGTEIQNFQTNNTDAIIKHHLIPVPEKAHIPLCIGHFIDACWRITDLRQVDINLLHQFLSAGGHPGILSYNGGSGGYGTGTISQDLRGVPEGFSAGHGVQQDSQGQDVFIIFLRINQLRESFETRLPAALNKYKSKHNGLPIGIVAYGPGMWEIFSRYLYLRCEGEGVIANVDCLLHFTDAGQPKTVATPYIPPEGRGWNPERSDYSVPRGYWTQ